MTYIFVGIFILTITATLYMIFSHRQKTLENELFRIKETFMTFVFAIGLWAETGTILYIMCTTPEKLAMTQTSTINTYIFLGASMLLGAILNLYYFLKQVIICESNITYISILGSTTNFNWNEITKIKLSQGNRLTLINKNHVKFTVGGDKSVYKKFIVIASKKIKPEVGKEILHNLKLSLKI